MAPTHTFPTKAQLGRMSLAQLRLLDVHSAEEEALVQHFVSKRTEAAPLVNPTSTVDFPDIKDAAQEAKFQKIKDARDKVARGMPLKKGEKVTV